MESSSTVRESGAMATTTSMDSTVSNVSPSTSSPSPSTKSSRHLRKPSSADGGAGDENSGMEEKLLHKLDNFLYRLESTLDTIEEYGSQKMSQMDESIKHAYQGLIRVRQEAIGEGKKRTEALLRVLEEHYHDALEPVYDGEAEGAMSSRATGRDGANSRGVKYRRLRRGHVKAGATASDSGDERSADSDGVADVDKDDYNAGLATDEDEVYELQDYFNERVFEGLSFLEDKLEYIENKCSNILDDTTVTLAAAISFALQAASSRLLTYDELPHPWKENPYITRGYRFCRNYADCVYSVVGVHNETCNIWSHLMGFFAMVGLAFYHLPQTTSWQEASGTDRAVMITFLIAAMKCLVCSSVWHTFSGISSLDAKMRFACFDYSGITVLIAASILTTEYTALYCNTTARAIYMAFTAISGLGGVMYTWHPSFDRPENRGKRISFFVGFAVAGVAGFLHTASIHGFGPSFLFYLPVFKSLFAYTCGVVIYALLIPERWFKGTIINYIGTSHNLWHVAVFLGIYYHYIATVQLLERARPFSCANQHSVVY